MLEHDIGTVNTFVDGVPTAQHHLVAGLYRTVVELCVFTAAYSGIRVCKESRLVLFEVAGAASHEVALLEDSIYSIHGVLDIREGSVVVGCRDSIRIREIQEITAGYSRY